RFETVWSRPRKALEALAPYTTLLSPDFSLYRDWPLLLQMWNVYRNRWCGAFWQRQGFTVIPTVSWSTAESVEFCFLGVRGRRVGWGVAGWGTGAGGGWRGWGRRQRARPGRGPPAGVSGWRWGSTRRGGRGSGRRQGKDSAAAYSYRRKRVGGRGSSSPGSGRY